MTRKAKDAKSLLTLQKTLSDLASWKLAAVENRKAALETSQKDLLDSLNRTDALSSALAKFVSKKLRDVETDMRKADIEHETRSREAVAHSARSKMAERIFARAETLERAHAERKDLADLIEKHSTSGKSSQA